MNTVKIGIIKEGKIPVDRRVPLTPAQAKEIIDRYPGTQVICQPSTIRCFSNDEYQHEGIELSQDMTDCDILFGVKEVPIEELIPNKTYFFFSHTIKKQAYNRELLKHILDNNIELIDYETLTNETGQRVVAFGRYAGIVGAYNGILAYGKRYNLFQLRPAHACFDLDDLKTEYKKVKLPQIKIAVTGGGRVAKGALEVLNGLGIRRVSPNEYLNERFNEPVYVQLNSRDYHKHKNGSPYSRDEFYKTPENYDSTFLHYASVTDLLIAGAFWDPKAPVLFKREDILTRSFKIKVIADITCDIEGSIPSTKKPSTIDEPVYDYNPSEDKVAPPFSDEGNLTVMAVDNLPCELPRNASEDFARDLIDNVIPYLLLEDSTNIIKRATIASNGQLTERYKYLQSFVNEG